MPRDRVLRRCQTRSSVRVLQIAGMFDLQPAANSERVWNLDLTLPDKWNIGVIVGPSGAGKSTVANHLFGDHVTRGFAWHKDRAFVDCFPGKTAVKDIAAMLTSVGLSSPPAWLRPFDSLSTGEQFRATLARALIEMADPVVMDEYTSVVDRTVARIMSAAVAKTIRRSGRRFVAVTCHFDVLDWLQPDWVYEPAIDRFSVGRSLRRPPIKIEVRRCTAELWSYFHHHHYLTGSLHPRATCFVGLIAGTPATFSAWIGVPMNDGSACWKEHRTVCLPDFQGVGIGNAVSAHCAAMMAASGRAIYSTTSHPAMIAHRLRDPSWMMIRKPRRVSAISVTSSIALLADSTSNRRITAGFRFVGKANPIGAALMGISAKIGRKS